MSQGQNFRKFSNLSRVTEEFSECPKKVTKLAQNGAKKKPSDFLGHRLLGSNESFSGPSGISKDVGKTSHCVQEAAQKDKVCNLIDLPLTLLRVVFFLALECKSTQIDSFIYAYSSKRF